MEELQCALLGIGAPVPMAHVLSALSPTAGLTAVDATYGGASSPPAAMSSGVGNGGSLLSGLHPSERALVAAALPLASHHALLSEFCRTVSSGRRRFTPHLAAMIETANGSVAGGGGSGGSEGPPEVGLYHVAVGAALREGVLAAYFEAVRSLRAPADVEMLRRTFQAPLALCVAILLTDTPPQKAPPPPTHRHGAAGTSSSSRFPTSATVVAATDTAQMLRGIHRFVTSPDVPPAFRAQMHRRTYMAVLHHIAHYVANGRLLEHSAAAAQYRGPSSSGASHHPAVRPDFFIQPSSKGTHSASDDGSGGAAGQQQGTAVVHADKLPQGISPALAALILTTGRDRAILLGELALAAEDHAAATQQQGGLGGGAGGGPIYAGGSSAPRQAHDVNAFRVLMPRRLDGHGSQPQHDQQEQGALVTHAAAAKAIFAAIFNDGLCRRAVAYEADKAFNEKHTGGGWGNQSHHHALLQPQHQKYPSTLGVAMPEPGPSVHVLDAVELERRVDAAGLTWSRALWSIVSSGGVVEASTAAATVFGPVPEPPGGGPVCPSRALPRMAFASLHYHMGLLRDMFLCHRGAFWGTFVDACFPAMCHGGSGAVGMGPAGCGRGGSAYVAPSSNLDLQRAVADAFRWACEAAASSTLPPAMWAAADQRLNSTVGAAGAIAAVAVGTVAIKGTGTGVGGVTKGSSAQRLRRGGGPSYASWFAASPADELELLEQSFTMAVDPAVGSAAAAPASASPAPDGSSGADGGLFDEASALLVIRRVRRLQLRYHPPCGSLHLVVSPSAMEEYKRMFQLNIQLRFAQRALCEVWRVMGILGRASFGASTGSVAASVLATAAGAAAMARLRSAAARDFRAPGASDLLSMTSGDVRQMPLQLDAASLLPLTRLHCELQHIVSRMGSFLALDVQQCRSAELLRQLTPHVEPAPPMAAEGTAPPEQQGPLRSVFADPQSTAGLQRLPHTFDADGRRVTTGLNAATSSSVPRSERRWHPQEDAAGQGQVQAGNSPTSPTGATWSTIPPHHGLRATVYEPVIAGVDAARRAHDAFLGDVMDGSFLGGEADSRGEIAEAIAEALCLAHCLHGIVAHSRFLAAAVVRPDHTSTSSSLAATMPAGGLSGTGVASVRFAVSQEALRGLQQISARLQRGIVPVLVGHLSTSPNSADRALWTQLDFGRSLSAPDRRVPPAAHRADPTVSHQPTKQGRVEEGGGIRSRARVVVPAAQSASSSQPPARLPPGGTAAAAPPLPSAATPSTATATATATDQPPRRVVVGVQQQQLIVDAFLSGGAPPSDDDTPATTS